MKTHIKVGIVGYGYAAATFHAPLIAAVPGLELVAVASSDAAKVHAAWPQVAVCASASDLFAREEIDLVILPTPNDTHHALARLALAAGKHVVVDKPFTLTSAEARDLMVFAEAQQKFLSVFHNRRWDADFLTVQKLFASGQLGRVTHFESHFDRYRPNVPQRWRDGAGAGSGLWYDLGPHLVDQALCLFGQPQSIWLDLANQRDAALTDDWFHAVLRYGELRVILHASALVAHQGPRFVMHGTQGSYTKFGLDTQEAALKTGARPVQPDWGIDSQPGQLDLLRGSWMQQSTLSNETGDYPQFYRAMRDAIWHGAATPVAASEALQVMQLLELGQQSAAQGRVMPIAAGD
ncbi:oxidoreductase [Undibacterium sp. Ren11W]|uniref:oxidoreductase n=1 Tax=Undibacterium sp. Ren11W TaxID=3413045 RepID=UPI003BF3FB12